MKLLPFIDIPIVDIKTPPSETRLADLGIWAEGEKVKMSAAFLGYESDGDNLYDYKYQIGFIHENCLVSTKKVIEEVGEELLREDSKCVLRQHMELYYEKISSVPPWGSAEYVRLRREGYTPRVLEGPHKVGKLRPNQKREVIIGPRKQLVFGPLLS